MALKLPIFIVVCLVAWPKNAIEVALIQSAVLLLFSFKFKLISIRTTWTQLDLPEKQGGLYQNKVISSLLAIQRPCQVH